MNHPGRRCVAGAAAAGYTLSGVLLLRRMRRELLTTGQLSRPTVAWVYATYGTHTTASAWLLARRRAAINHSHSAQCLRWDGFVLALGGSGLYVAGSSRFAGPDQLSGTDVGTRINSGIYRYSRHPQYTGIVLTLAGLALARRSPAAAALAAGAAAAYQWWVPVGEAHLEAAFGPDYRRYRARTPVGSASPPKPPSSELRKRDTHAHRPQPRFPVAGAQETTSTVSLLECGSYRR